MLAALALVSSCTVEPVVTNITVTPTNFTLDAIGDTAQLAATVTAQDGRPLPGASVTWASDNAAATVNASGLVTAVGNGTARITATANSATGTATANVSQQVDNLAKTGGDGQTGEVGTALATALGARANDRLGNPVAGVNVVFSVSAGGGSVATGVVTTPAAGTASTTWTLGRVAGATQAVTASAQGKTASFGATATRGPADSLVKVSGDNQFAPASTAATDSLVVRVADRFGNPVPGHAVTFAVTQGGGSVSPTNPTTGTNGRAPTRFTLGPTGGAQNRAQATASGVTTGSPATFTATALSGTVAVFEGNNQTGLVGFGVNVAPAIRVVDQSNQPLLGLVVTFAVTSGGGSVTGGTTTTGANGVARVGEWTLGLSAGANTMNATVTGSGFAGNPAQFSATGAASAFNIELRNLTTLTAAQQTAFDNAKTRWQQLVFGDLPDRAVNVDASQCVTGAPNPVNETIDDVVIYVRVGTIDGPSNTLASAGPCFLRTSGNLPLIGQMNFDIDDIGGLESSGTLTDVVLHEMGHVLGFGTLWGPSYFNFLQNPSLPDPGGEDTHFNGPKAIAAFDALGGTSYTGGMKVPVENTQGGAGTRDAHWRESTFDHELMTGFIEAVGGNPLSRLSVASLWDIGYVVNLDGADAYTRVFTGPALAARAGGRQLLLNDIATGPIYVVGPSGRVVRVLKY